MILLPWKFLFWGIILAGSLIAMSASSWLMAWMGLEINLLALLAVMMSDKSPRNSEASLKYFLIQALASAILISSAFASSSLFTFLSSLSFFSSVTMLSLLMKIGSAPFHFWIPQIVEGLSWINNSILLSWQKVAPFALLSSCLESKFSKYMLVFCIIMSSLYGGILGLSQTSIRKILSFSSINHIGWMLAGILTKISIWLVYFIFYSTLLLMLIKIVHQNNISSLNNSYFSIEPKIQIPFFVSLMSFGGLPPLMGFLPKWLIVQSMPLSFSLVLIMVMSSLLALFFYFRIMFSNLMVKNNTMKTSVSYSSFPSFILFVNLVGLVIAPLVMSL